ncbi:hypothetical protein ACNKHQ_18705 [Shigella flexneri]
MRNPHHSPCCWALAPTAIYPYLASETLRQQVKGALAEDQPAPGHAQLPQQHDKGLLQGDAQDGHQHGGLFRCSRAVSRRWASPGPWSTLLPRRIVSRIQGCRLADIQQDLNQSVRLAWLAASR